MSNVANLGSVRLYDLTASTDDWWDGLDKETREQEDFYETLCRNVRHYLDTVRKAELAPDACTLDGLAIRAPAQLQTPVHRLVRLFIDGMPNVEFVKQALAVDWEKNPEYRANEDTLSLWAYLTGHWPAIHSTTEKVVQYVVDQFAPLFQNNPQGAFLTAPAYQLLPNAKGIVDAIFRLFTEPPLHLAFDTKRRHHVRIFIPTEPLRWKLNSNHEAFCSRRGLNRETTSPMRIDAPIHELVEGYFQGTPLLDFFKAPAAFAWPRKVRQRHTLILGDSGAGKSTLLKNLIEYDMFENPDRPSLVVIDPHDSLISWAASLATKRRVLLLDAGDVNYPPSINPLALNEKRYRNGTPQQRERMEGDILDTLTYLVGALGFEMTGPMQSFFNYLGQLMLAYPRIEGRPGTLGDLLDALKSPAGDDMRARIEQLSERPREFLLRELFVAKGTRDIHAQTRDALRSRLEGILSRASRERLFTCSQNAIDWYEELNNGSIILVNTNDSAIGEESSKLFGRMVIGLVIQALKMRSPDIPEERRYPVYVYVDEAHNFFSDQTEKVLTDFRKLGAGALFAHQHLQQPGLSDDLRAGLLNLTNTKFGAKLKLDASRMAPLMATTTEFLQSLPDYTFAAHIDGITPTAVPFRTHLPKRPLLSRAGQEVFKWKNRERVSFGLPPKPVPRETELPQEPDGEYI